MYADVIIIGAGAAGLSAAQALSDAGRTVIILEARDRIGGRIFTRHERGSNVPVELGAEFIHGRPDATWKLVREAGLSAVDLPFEQHRLRGGRLVGMEQLDAGMEKIMAGLAHVGPQDISFAEYLARRRDARSMAAARKFALHFVQGFDAADPQRISAKSLAEEHEGIGDLEEQLQFRLLDGYGAIAEHLCRKVDPAKVKIRLRTPVSEICWKKGQVECSGGKLRRIAFRASRAIITLPLGILQLAPEIPGAVRFSPDIAGKRDVAMQLASGPIVKAVLRFHSAFWEDPGGAGLKGVNKNWRDAAFIYAPDSPFPTWWTQRPLRAPMLTAWAGGPKALALAGKSTAQLQQIAIRVLSKLTGVTTSRLAARLQSFHAHDWASDPYSRGAYSYVAVGGMNARKHLAEPIEQTLYFAGEAPDTSGQASTVAGAIASGERAAREVLRHSLL